MKFFRPRLLFLLAVLVWPLLASDQAFCAPAVPASPIPLASQLELNDSKTSFNLGPFLYVTRDPDHTLSFKDVLDRHNSGYRGDGIRGNILTLGASMVPHWVVFSVENQSWTDRWILSFGQHLQGRQGLVKQIFLYDVRSGQKYLDNITPAQNPYIGQQGQGATNVAVTIPHGGQSLFFLYVVPEAGMPVTLAPKLITEQSFNQQLASPLDRTRLMNLFFAVMIGFFLASIFVEKSWVDLLFVAYYGLQMAAFNFSNATLYTPTSFAPEMNGWLFSGGVIVALMAAKFYLEIGPLQYQQNRIFLGLIVAIFVVSGVALLVPSPFMVHALLLFLPGLIGLLYLFFALAGASV